MWHLVLKLRAAGNTRGLLDEVYRRLSDAALLDRATRPPQLTNASRDNIRLKFGRTHRFCAHMDLTWAERYGCGSAARFPRRQTRLSRPVEVGDVLN